MSLSLLLLAGCAHIETLWVGQCDGVDANASPERLERVLQVADAVALQHRMRATSGKDLAFLKQIHEESPEADNLLFGEWTGGRGTFENQVIVTMRVVVSKRTRHIIVMITDETPGATDEQTLAIRDAMRSALTAQLPGCQIDGTSRTDGPLWVIGP